MAAFSTSSSVFFQTPPYIDMSESKPDENARTATLIIMRTMVVGELGNRKTGPKV